MIKYNEFFLNQFSKIAYIEIARAGLISLPRAVFRSASAGGDYALRSKITLDFKIRAASNTHVNIHFLA